MYTFETSVFINRPQQEVFDFIANPDHIAEWSSSLETVELASEGPVGEGSKLRSVAKFLGREVESTAEITSWNPPHQFSQKSTGGPIPYEVTFICETQENGTLLIQSAQAELGGFFKLAEGLVGKQFEKQFESDLENLKDLLESD